MNDNQSKRDRLDRNRMRNCVAVHHSIRSSPARQIRHAHVRTAHGAFLSGIREAHSINNHFALDVLPSSHVEIKPGSTSSQDGDYMRERILVPHSFRFRKRGAKRKGEKTEIGSSSSSTTVDAEEKGSMKRGKYRRRRRKPTHHSSSWYDPVLLSS